MKRNITIFSYFYALDANSVDSTMQSKIVKTQGKTYHLSDFQIQMDLQRQ